VFCGLIRPGWYWLHELEGAKRAGLIDEIRFYSWLAYVPCDCPKPLRAFEEMYLKRLQVGKNTPQGVALKLAYNSPYGKMAQSVGQPKYANAVYASLITAGCRCMILDVIATHPLGANGVLMVATDGIFFTELHPKIVPNPEALGQWTMSERRDLMLFKPGMYWDDGTREQVRNGEFAKVDFKTRGVNREAMAKAILALDGKFAAMKPGDEWPSLDIKIPFQVISPYQALARNKWRLCGAVSNTQSIRISADPRSKRFAIAPGWSEPYERETPLRSTPYNAAFGDETVPLDLLDPARAALTDNLHPDGFLLHQLAEMFFDGGPGIGEI